MYNQKAGEGGEMSIGEALRFFTAIESDREIRNAVGGLSSDAGLADLVVIARDHGFSCSVEELREAFSRDADLKKAFYARSNQV